MFAMTSKYGLFTSCFRVVIATDNGTAIGQFHCTLYLYRDFDMHISKVRGHIQNGDNSNEMRFPY